MTIDVEAEGRTGFVNLNLAGLREAAEVLQISVGPATKEDTLRAKLVAAYANVQGLVPEPVVEAPNRPSLKPRRSIFDDKPNLNSSGKWGGQRRRVLVQRGPDTQETKSPYVPLRWEDNLLYVPFDKPTDIPYPHYEALKNAKGNKVTNERFARPDGSFGFNHNLVPFQAFPFTDMGVTPGTEGLPISKLDYWQRQGKKTNYFRNADGTFMNRKILIQIRNDLFDAVSRDFYSKMTDDDIWTDVFVFLYGEEALDEILYAEAA